MVVMLDPQNSLSKCLISEILFWKRLVPYATLSKVDEELNRLQLQGVITPYSYSVWVTPTVVIKKANGTTRMYADFSTGLNVAL